MKITGRLKKEYPDVDRTLNYDRVWKLLVSVRLAAQRTDARVNVAIGDLCAKCLGVGVLAEVDVENIERVVKPCGLGYSKTRGISTYMKILKEQYEGKVPDDPNVSSRLPGVGKRNANPTTGDVFGKLAIVMDIYYIHLVNRMGLIGGIKGPKKVEMALWKLVPLEEGNNFCHRLVFHGRDVCTARTEPHYESCCLNDICKKAGAE